MSRTLVLAAVIAVLLPSSGAAQSDNKLVGTWKLVSVSSSTVRGEKTTSGFGEHPTGFITYTREGRMSAIIANGGRKPLSVNSRVTARPDERAEAYATFLAYAGRYTFKGDKVVHHVEVASIQNWVGTDLTRSVTLQGNRVALRTPVTQVDGVMRSTELVWEKVK